MNEIVLRVSEPLPVVKCQLILFQAISNVPGPFTNLVDNLIPLLPTNAHFRCLLHESC